MTHHGRKSIYSISALNDIHQKQFDLLEHLSKLRRKHDDKVLEQKIVKQLSWAKDVELRLVRWAPRKWKNELTHSLSDDISFDSPQGSSNLYSRRQIQKHYSYLSLHDRRLSQETKPFSRKAVSSSDAWRNLTLDNEKSNHYSDSSVSYLSTGKSSKMPASDFNKNSVKFHDYTTTSKTRKNLTVSLDLPDISSQKSSRSNPASIQNNTERAAKYKSAYSYSSPQIKSSKERVAQNIIAYKARRHFANKVMAACSRQDQIIKESNLEAELKQLNLTDDDWDSLYKEIMGPDGNVRAMYLLPNLEESMKDVASVRYLRKLPLPQKES